MYSWLSCSLPRHEMSWSCVYIRGVCTAVLLICVVQALASSTYCTHTLTVNTWRSWDTWSTCKNEEEGSFGTDTFIILTSADCPRCGGASPYLFWSRNYLFNSNSSWSYILTVSLDPCKCIWQMRVCISLWVKGHSATFFTKRSIHMFCSVWK